MINLHLPYGFSYQNNLSYDLLYLLTPVTFPLIYGHFKAMTSRRTWAIEFSYFWYGKYFWSTIAKARANFTYSIFVNKP